MTWTSGFILQNCQSHIEIDYRDTEQEEKEERERFPFLVRQDNETLRKAVHSGTGEKNRMIKQDAYGSKKNPVAWLCARLFIYFFQAHQLTEMKWG